MNSAEITRSDDAPNHAFLFPNNFDLNSTTVVLSSEQTLISAKSGETNAIFSLFEDRPLYYNVHISSNNPITVSDFQKASVLNAETPASLVLQGCELEVELMSADETQLSGIAGEQSKTLKINDSVIKLTLRSAGTASLLA